MESNNHHCQACKPQRLSLPTILDGCVDQKIHLQQSKKAEAQVPELGNCNPMQCSVFVPLRCGLEVVMLAFTANTTGITVV